jgi:large subunit ribosomal protein L3
MAGHLGSKQVTIQSLKLADIDTERNLLLVKGSVPGHKGSYILVKDSIKRK